MTCLAAFGPLAHGESELAERCEKLAAVQELYDHNVLMASKPAYLQRRIEDYARHFSPRQSSDDHPTQADLRAVQTPKGTLVRMPGLRT